VSSGNIYIIISVKKVNDHAGTHTNTEGSAPVHKHRHHTKTENRASTVDTDKRQDHWTKKPFTAADREKNKTSQKN
jgi:hypothetical protein